MQEKRRLEKLSVRVELPTSFLKTCTRIAMKITCLGHEGRPTDGKREQETFIQTCAVCCVYGINLCIKGEEGNSSGRSPIPTDMKETRLIELLHPQNGNIF